MLNNLCGLTVFLVFTVVIADVNIQNEHPRGFPEQQAKRDIGFCVQGCHKIIQEVCGSDGKTYVNGCELKNANCYRRPNDRITIVNYGPCENETPSLPEGEAPSLPEGETPSLFCRLPCPSILLQVCGSDGITYPNPCLLHNKNCERPVSDQITIVSYKPCEDIPTVPRCEPGCPKILNPVCGSDGVTYSNRCMLNLANCDRPPNNQITIVHEGACKKIRPSSCRVRPCPKLYRPVCGSDGVTYPNPCRLQNENCKRPSDQQITKVSNGECSGVKPRTEK